MKKYNQQLTLLNILEKEEISLSTLAKSIEVNRTYLGKLKNHEVQLSDENFSKVIEAYPEYKVKSNAIENNHLPKGYARIFRVKSFDKAKSKETQSSDYDQNHYEQLPEGSELLTLKGSKKVSNKFEISPTPKGTSPSEAFPGYIKLPSLITEKGEARHRNLRCPVSNYHMKLIHSHLLTARPFCPISGKAMLLKEENLKYKKLNEKDQENYLLKFEDKDYSQKSIRDCLKNA